MSDGTDRPSIEQLQQERDEALARYETVSAMLERSNDQAHVIYNLSKSIAATHSLPDMLPQIISIIRRAVRCDRATLYLVDGQRKNLELIYADGFSLNGPVRINIGDGLPGRIVEIGDHSHVHDLALFYETFNDFIHLPGEEKRDGSHIGIALKSWNATIGALSIDTPVKYGLSVEDMDFLVLVSPLLSSGIEKATLFAKTIELARTDGLTGLYNHRVFEERLEQEISRRSRTRKPLALIMIDVDHFKRFNDTYGHQEGDTVLKELAEILNGQCRHTTIDACFRYGGEEFVVILPEEELSHATSVAERIRRAVEEHPFSIKREHRNTTVTISLGVAVAAPDEQVTGPELLKRSDDALYTAKRNGRNRVSH
jgi:diguanylate cyclase (GGDEF)-like protein